MNRRQLLRRGLLLGAAGLAGCQNGGEPTTTRTTTATTDTATDVSTPSPTATATDTATEEPTETATPEPPAIPPTLERTYESSENIGSFSDVVVLDSGDYVFAGATGAAGESAAGWLVRVDPEGNQQWAQSYGSGTTRFSGVTQTADGTLVAVGRTGTDDGTSAGFVQAAVTDGTARWSTTLDRDLGNGLNDVTRTGSGVIAAGIAELREDGSGVGWAVTLDSSGTVVTERTVGDAFIRVFNGVAGLGDGRYALSGATSPVRGRSDGFLAVVDDQLETAFSRTYDEQVFEAFRDATVLADGGLLLVGDTTSRRTMDDRNEDAWIVRTDSQGVQQWSTIHDVARGDRVTGAVQREDGSFFCVGRTNRSSASLTAGFAARVSSDGTVTETSTYGDAGEGDESVDYLDSIDRAPDGTLVAAGLKNLGQTDGTVTGAGWLLTF